MMNSSCSRFSRRLRAAVPAGLLITCALLAQSIALRFRLNDRERRCFRFEAPYDSKVLGHAMVDNGRGSAELSIEIQDRLNHVVYQTQYTEASQSSFSFRTPSIHSTHASAHYQDDDDDEYQYDAHELEGSYTACLVLSLDRSTHDPNSQRAVSFWVRPEEGSAEFETPGRHASEEHVSAMTDALQRMHETLRFMISDLATLQQRERRLVKRNYATSRTLHIFASLSLIVMIATAVMQFLHFKTYFKAKKLL